jgi:hypothetical protein
MPHKKKPRRYITPLVLFTLAGWALWALGRNEPASSETPDAGTTDRRPATASTIAPARTRATWSKRRLATSLVFATLFFGGAAFSAGAGDVVSNALEDDSADVTSTEEAPADDSAAEESNNKGEDAAGGGEEAEAPGEDQPAEGEDGGDNHNGGGQPGDGGSDPGDGGSDPGDGGSDPGDGGGQPGDGGNGGGQPGDDGGQPGDGTPPPPLPDDDDNPSPPDPGIGDGPDHPSPHSDLPVIDQGTRSPAQLDPEASADDFFATIWLHQPLPDPTPPAKRLKPWFAKALAHESAEAGVDWALVLGVLRARGFDASSMSVDTVRTTATRLVELRTGSRTPAGMVRAYGGEEFARNAIALRNYNRAVGLGALVSGFEAAKPKLQRMVLRDKRMSIYAGGRLDIAMGRIDVRILVLLRYLAEAHGQVTVSCLLTGHRLYARPGVISAHIYGLAVDIAALDGVSIYGHQEPGGLTEHAVRNILRLPSEMQPKQVISLLGLGGPSFPLADHDDHIHVGY